MSKSLFLFFVLCAVLVSSPVWAVSGALGKIVVLTDDILIGSDMFDKEDSFEELLKKKIIDLYSEKMEVVTMAQEGATTVSSMAFVPQVLAEKPNLVIIAIGYNDALAKNNPDVVYNNLDNLLKELERAGAYVLLIGVEAPVWMEHSYATKFNNIYPRISQRYQVIYHNGFLKGVQGNPELTLEDRYHPNRLGVEKIVDNILPGLGPVIKTLRRVRSCERNPNGHNCEKYLPQDATKR